MSIAAVPAAAEVASAAGAAGGAKAATGKAAGSSRKASSARWAASQAATLRARGLDDAAIRSQLGAAGYPAGAAKTAAPDTSRPAAQPADTSTAADTIDDPDKAPAGPSFGQRVSNRVPAGGGASGLLLGLVLYPVALAFLRDGNAGVSAWWKAKFLNKVSAATAGASGQSGTGTGAAGAGAGGGGGSSW